MSASQSYSINGGPGGSSSTGPPAALGGAGPASSSGGGDAAAILTPSVAKWLVNANYEKRKKAALELEALVREAIFEKVTKDCRHRNSQYCADPIVAGVNCSAGGVYLSMHLNFLILPLLH